ncbi:MAG TPA: response regulator transcription factor [Bdellovibrionota bacterium]|jgi:DNA-binding response OmpR family regulator|nr:response regulator transcription factor [Bdellovibrionota bacterium]
MEKHRILIIEDNPDTRRFLEAMLGKEFDILTAENGVIGIDYARNKAPDLILLDIMLPILSGYDACSLLKKDEKTKHIPIIFLSAKNSVPDITHGLTSGADDYIPKPFDYKELVARIKARLRKSADKVAQPIQVGDLRIDPASREVSFGGKKAQLTLTEFDILRYLAVRAGSVVSREEILKEVWKDESNKTNDRTIDVHIRALRRKIPPLTKHIISIYGVGYRYEK